MIDCEDRRQQLAGAPLRIVRRADARRGAAEVHDNERMMVPLSRAVGFLLGLSLLIGCTEDEGGGGGLPTAPGFSTPSIRGIYSAPDFWTFEVLRLADDTRVTWTCMGRVTIARQTGTDFLGSFTLVPPDTQRCEDTSGNISSGVVRDDAWISFEAGVTGEDPIEFFALPGCVVVTQDSLWTGTVAGNRFVASRGLTVDCPSDGRVQITSRADGPRTATFDD